MTDMSVKNLNALAQQFNDAVGAALKQQNVRLLDILDFDGLCDFEDAVGSIAVGATPYNTLIAELDTMQPLRIADFFAGLAERAPGVKLPAVPAAMTEATHAEFYQRNNLPALAKLSRG